MRGNTNIAWNTQSSILEQACHNRSIRRWAVSPSMQKYGHYYYQTPVIYQMWNPKGARIAVNSRERKKLRNQTCMVVKQAQVTNHPVDRSFDNAKAILYLGNGCALQYQKCRWGYLITHPTCYVGWRLNKKNFSKLTSGIHGSALQKREGPNGNIYRCKCPKIVGCLPP